MIELAVDQSIEEVLNRGFYLIPRFQRPYSWTADNVGDFWSDTIQSNSTDYFIGSVIVYETGDTKEQRRTSPEYAIVDGQQRLTTITILLAAIRDAFTTLGRQIGSADQTLAIECDSLADGIQSFIERGDRRARQRRILTSETGYPYLQTFVQSIAAEQPEKQPALPDEKRIESALTYFKNQLEELTETTWLDPTIRSESRHRTAVDRLEEVRDRVLNLSVILVVVSNEDDAYEIFETLNTRGQDLNLADLVRNFLLRDLREEAEGVDSPRQRYAALLEALHEPEASIDPAQFILHSWLSRQDYTSGKKLFRDMKKRIQGPQAKRELLLDLETDAPLYRKARYPRQVDWGQFKYLGESIDALIVFRMTQPLPLILAALRAHDEGRLTLRNLRRLLGSIESFHLRFTAIAGKSSSGGISKRYAGAAQRMSQADGPSTARVTNELVTKLRESTPTAAEFRAGFTELRFSSSEVGQKQLVQYVLKRFYEDGSEGSVKIDFTSMSIEHLAPERAAETGGQLNPGQYGSIGNLILVSQDLNKQLANRDWVQKVAILRKQREIWIPEDVLSADHWGPQQIQARLEAMNRRASSLWRV
jgi:uncharacterized protein with ParB-like and HNH nuclease domain